MSTNIRMRWMDLLLGGRSWSKLITLPAAVGIVFFFILPVLGFLAYAFLTAGRFSVSPPLTLENFAQALSSAVTLQMAYNSLVIGLVVGSLCVLFGMPVAAWIRYRAGEWEFAVLLLFVIAMFASYLVRIYAWRMMLGESGAINSVLLGIGVIDAPIPGLLFSKVAVVLSMIHIGMPWVVLIIYSALKPLEPRYLEAALDLGATFWQTWWKVMFPLLAAPIGTAFLLTFILASADYVAPQFLAGPKDQLVGVQIQADFLTRGNWGRGAATSLMTLMVYAAAYAVLLLLLRVARLNKIEWES